MSRTTTLFLECTICGLLLALPSRAISGPVRTTFREEAGAAVTKQVKSDLPALIEFYRDRHAHPELSLQEEVSAGKIAARLEAVGFSVTRGVGGHGVVAVLQNGSGPTVLVRGDTDALPITEQTGVPYASKVRVKNTDGSTVGAMHACGHDIHQTCLVGTGKVLAELREHWRGTAVLIAQPAEEIGMGARLMIEDGLFERFPKPDYCIALHVSSSLPTGTIGYTSGWAHANVDSVDITVIGQSGHGSRPNETIDPVMAAAQVVVALQTIVSRRVDPIEPAVITVGSFHAGSKHNIISNEAKLQLTVRSYTEKTRQILLEGIREVTVNTCRAMGCTTDPIVSVRDHEFTPAGYNDPELTSAAVEVLGKVIGADHVRVQKARMGGEDFGRYASYLNVPGFMFGLGSIDHAKYEASLEPHGAPLPSLHSSKYIPDAEPTITTGVRSLATLAISLMAAPE